MFDLLHARQDIDIRPTRTEDLEGVARVSVDTWRTTYAGLLPFNVLRRLRYRQQEEHHRLALSRSHTVHYVAVEPFTREVVGFANGGPARQPNLGYEGEIYELYVQHGFQRRGIGQGLFEAVNRGLAAGDLKGLIIWVLGSNPNRPFYETIGGRLVSRQPSRMGGFTLQEVAYAWEPAG